MVREARTRYAKPYRRLNTELCSPSYHSISNKFPKSDITVQNAMKKPCKWPEKCVAAPGSREMLIMADSSCPPAGVTDIAGIDIVGRHASLRTSGIGCYSDMHGLPQVPQSV